MKKNGFIATSLIYSFFLIFITLFLTIIADYLQNKVLLNSIEKGIKDEINSVYGINDFEVGDMVSFVGDCSEAAAIDNQWVVVKVDYTEDAEEVVFYSYDFVGTLPSGSPSSKTVLGTEFKDDIEMGYQNATYFNKILYTFQVKNGANENKDYKITDNMYVSINCSSTDTVVAGYEKYSSGTNCIKNSGTNLQRWRYILPVKDSRYTNCLKDDSATIILDIVE